MPHAFDPKSYAMILRVLIFFIFFSSFGPFGDTSEAPPASNGKLKLHVRKMLTQGEGFQMDRQGNSLIKIQCPNCQDIITVINQEKSNPTRGIDRDFCKHTRKKTQNDLDIWSCPNCGYSHHKSFFINPPSTSLSEDEQSELKGFMISLHLEHLGINVHQLGYQMEQEDIPTVIKYTLMEKLLPKLDCSAKTKADFYLNFAWCERRRLCSPISSPSLSNTLGLINEELNNIASRDDVVNITSQPQIVISALHEIQAMHRGALLQFTCQLLEIDQLDRLGHRGHAIAKARTSIQGNNPKELRALAKFKYDRLINETSHLKECLIHMKDAIRKNEYSFNELSSCIYLIGELHRRVGLYDEAKLWLTKACSIGPQTLRTWASEQLSSLPQVAINKVSEGESILLHTAIARLKTLKPVSPNIPPSSLSHRLAKRWMESLHLACTKYHDLYQIDPESLNELFHLELLKGQPNLQLDSLRYFQLEIDKNSLSPSSRYTIKCILPFKDSLGFFSSSYKQGSFQRHSSFN